MNIDNGGPAFPSPPVVENGVIYPGNDGMTLRDYFAAKAAQGLLAAPDCGWDAEQLANGAYAIADAMLKARES